MSSSSKINSIINLRVLNQFDSFLRCLRSKVPSANLKQGLRIGHILYLISQSDSQLFRSWPLLRRKLTDKPQQTNKPGNSKLHILHIAPYCLHCKESDCLIGQCLTTDHFQRLVLNEESGCIVVNYSTPSERGFHTLENPYRGQNTIQDSVVPQDSENFLLLPLELTWQLAGGRVWRGADHQGHRAPLEAGGLQIF